MVVIWNDGFSAINGVNSIIKFRQMKEKIRKTDHMFGENYF